MRADAMKLYAWIVETGFLNRRRHTVLCLILSFLCTFTMLAAMIPNHWDITTYNITALKRFVRRQKEFQDKIKVKNLSSSFSEDNETECLRSGHQVNIETIISGSVDAYVMVDTDNCTRADCTDLYANTGRFSNATLLMTEYSGIWELCRVGGEEEWEKVWYHCGNQTRKCYNHFQEYRLGSYCCGGCCPFPENIQLELDEDGRSTHELLGTMKSSAIVSLILQLITYVEILLALVFNYITMHTMSGVTLFLSGMFLMFSLIANHYKIYVMNSLGRSLAYLPCEVVSEGVRHTVPGLSTWIAWINLLVACIACIAWVRFSRFLVRDAFKAPPKPPKPNPKPSTVARRIQSANVAAMNGRKTGAT